MKDFPVRWTVEVESGQPAFLVSVLHADRKVQFLRTLFYPRFAVRNAFSMRV